MLKPVNDEELLHTLDKMMQGYGNGARTAQILECSYSHVRQWRAGRRRIPQRVAKKLGYELKWVRKELL